MLLTLRLQQEDLAPTEDWIGPLKTGLYITEYEPRAALTRTALLPLIMIIIILILILIIIIIIIIIIIVIIMIIKSYKIRNTFTRFFRNLSDRMPCTSRSNR